MIGASRQPGRIGHELFRNLLEYGFEGPVYPVHPTSVSVAGVRAYASVLEVPDAVDLAIVVVPARRRPRGRAASARRRACTGWSSSPPASRRAGAEGKDAERELVAAARSNGMRIIGPNCLGVVNTAPDRADERDVRARAARSPATSRSSRSRVVSASS